MKKKKQILKTKRLRLYEFFRPDNYPGHGYVIASNKSKALKKVVKDMGPAHGTHVLPVSLKKARLLL